MKDEERDKEIEFMDMEEQESNQTKKEAPTKKGSSGPQRSSLPEEDDWQDEPEPMKPGMMVLVFLGLVVLAAAICALLWAFTHGNDDKSPDTATEGPVIIATDEPAQSPQGQELQTPSPTEQSTSTSEPEQTPVITETPDVTVTPATVTPATVATASPAEPEAQEPTDGDVSMSFNQVQESVTPKDVVNLRSVPSTADENTVVVQVTNGEVLSRTGINPNMGWSRIDYNGQTLYAVSQYLTTDLSYKPPVHPSDPNRVTTVSGRVIIFENCDDYLTPKEYVNLRTEPSTTEGDATVRCQVNNGETVHRTGYSPDYGWSRVEYNGEVLYVVTSLMQAP